MFKKAETKVSTLVKYCGIKDFPSSLLQLLFLLKISIREKVDDAPGRCVVWPIPEVCV